MGVPSAAVRRRCLAGVLLVGLALLACTSGGDAEPVLQPVIDAKGIVAAEALFHDDHVLDLSRAPDVEPFVRARLPSDGEEVVVLGEDGADPRSEPTITVTRYELDEQNEFNYSDPDRERIGGRSAVTGPAVHALAQCEADGVAIQLDERVGAQVASREFDQDVLEDVAAAVQLEDGRLTFDDLPEDLAVLATLPAGWRSPPDGSRTTFGYERTGFALVLGRIEPEAADVLAALMCPDPPTTPLPTASRGDLSGQQPHEVGDGDRRAFVGVITYYDQVALVRGDPGLYALVTFSGDPPLSDARLADLLAEVEPVSDARFGPLAAELDERQTREARARIEPEVRGKGFTPLVSGTTRGLSWMLASGVANLGAGPPTRRVCLVPVRLPAGSVPSAPLLLGTGCIGEQNLGPDLVVGLEMNLFTAVTAAVTPRVERVVMDVPHADRVVATPVETGDPVFPRVAVLVPRDRFDSRGHSEGGGTISIGLEGGSATISALDAAGNVVARTRFGTTNCYLPPGCPEP